MLVHDRESSFVVTKVPDRDTDEKHKVDEVPHSLRHLFWLHFFLPDLIHTVLHTALGKDASLRPFINRQIAHLVIILRKVRSRIVRELLASPLPGRAEGFPKVAVLLVLVNQRTEEPLYEPLEVDAQLGPRKGEARGTAQHALGVVSLLLAPRLRARAALEADLIFALPVALAFHFGSFATFHEPLRPDALPPSIAIDSSREFPFLLHMLRLAQLAAARGVDDAAQHPNDRCCDRIWRRPPRTRLVEILERLRHHHLVDVTLVLDQDVDDFRCRVAAPLDIDKIFLEVRRLLLLAAVPRERAAMAKAWRRLGTRSLTRRAVPRPTPIVRCTL